MTRSLLLASVVAATMASPPASLREAGESARAAWHDRELAAFVSVAGGGPLLVTLPGGRGSSPLRPQQARAILASYVQGTQEVATVLQEAVEVDSTEGYVRITRIYRLTGLPGERESMMLLGFRRGRGDWVMTEVRISD